MRYRLYNWFWSAIDLLFPPSCAGCNVPGTRWCQDCHGKVSRIFPPYCEICGQHFPLSGICGHCKINPPRISGVRSWAWFKGPIRNALHRFKYQRDIALGDVFTDSLIEVFYDSGWLVDFITPVPLGVARQRERGYNQASLLARPIAFKMKMSYLPNALIRTRETLTQIELSRKQRQENVAGAFHARSTDVLGKSVLVVDDIATSGSTLDSCADALFLAGAVKVFGLTLARAEFA